MSSKTEKLKDKRKNVISILAASCLTEAIKLFLDG